MSNSSTVTYVIWIFDDFLKCPEKEREKALGRQYETISHNGLNYRGIVFDEDVRTLRRISDLIYFPVNESKCTIFFRRYLENEENETYIHSDVLIGGYTAILFLNTPEQCQGGTAFWRHKHYGWDHHPPGELLKRDGLRDEPKLWSEIYEDGFDESKWDQVRMVPMKFNRLIVFWSPLYHSRFPKTAFGSELSSSRLIKVFFLK